MKALDAFVLTALCFSRGTQASLLTDILAALENATDCASCEALLVPMQTLAHTGNDAFSSTFTTICTTLGVRPFFIILSFLDAYNISS